MNFSQGMQRLAIFTGVLGAVAGGFYAYKDLHNLPSQRTQYRFFENLAATDFVKQEQAQLISLKATGAQFSWPITTPIIHVPKGLTLTADTSADWEAIVKKYGGTIEDPPSPWEAIAKKYGGTVEDPPPSAAISIPSGMDSKRIKTVFWNNDLSVNFFVMDDGGIVGSYKPRSAWWYLLAVMYPMLGFITAWGLIRGVGWVTLGFIQTIK